MTASVLAWLGRLGAMFIGYGAAVFVAVGVTIFFWQLPAILLEGGAEESVSASMRDLRGLYQMGLFVTAPTAFPGFLFTLIVASAKGWEKWLPYSLAGAINAVPSLAFLTAWLGGPLFSMPIGLMLACLPGGFAGGLAYWAVAGRIGKGGAAVADPEATQP